MELSTDDMGKILSLACLSGIGSIEFRLLSVNWFVLTISEDVYEMLFDLS